MEYVEKEMENRLIKDSMNYSNLGAEAQKGISELKETFTLMGDDRFTQTYIRIEQGFDSNNELKNTSIRFFDF